jgi:hypothetical protein
VVFLEIQVAGDKAKGEAFFDLGPVFPFRLAKKGGTKMAPAKKTEGSVPVNQVGKAGGREDGFATDQVKVDANVKTRILAGKTGGRFGKRGGGEKGGGCEDALTVGQHHTSVDAGGETEIVRGNYQVPARHVSSLESRRC